MVADDQSTVDMVRSHEPGMPSRPLPPLCPLEEAQPDEMGETIELDEREEEDCAPVRIAPEPGDPTMEEVEDHRATHLPYRSWCPTA